MVKIDVVGSLEYGTPFLISIREGNFATSYIVYADSEDEALDNLAKYFDYQSIPADTPEENEEDYYYGSGFYPFYLPDVHIREITETEVDKLLIRQKEALDGIYFYNGFREPKKLASDIHDLLKRLEGGEVSLSSNHLGNVNEDVIQEIEMALEIKDPNEQRFELDRGLFEFDLFINPRKEELSKINTYSYGLDENAYLDEVFS